MTLQQHVSAIINGQVTEDQAKTFASENFNILCSSIRDQQQNESTSLDHVKADKAISSMEKYGGGFIKGLADLYRRADLSNRKKLYNTFYNEFEKYSKM